MDEVKTGFLFVSNGKILVTEDGAYEFLSDLLSSCVNIAFPCSCAIKAEQTAEKTGLKVYELVLKEFEGLED